VLVQIQWQLIPETTMHAFNINAWLTMIVINKLTERTRKWPETDTIFFSQCKIDQCGSKNTHTAVLEKLAIIFFGLKVIVFNATFNNISVISWRSVLLVEETRVPRENHWPVTSHWQTFITRCCPFRSSCMEREPFSPL
jgi:hypothetical protein